MAGASNGKVAPIIIIKKKKRGGGHGHHGGAWKVAYADFVTAMMCFFLVMWLMGADEATKAQIADYFNHSPWDTSREPSSVPNQGDALLKGQNGAFPDDLVKNPVPPLRPLPQAETAEHRYQELLDEHFFGLGNSIDYLKFSIPADLLFKDDMTILRDDADQYLERYGKLFKSYQGYVSIRHHMEDGDNDPQGYELSLARSAAVKRHMVEKIWVAEDRISTPGDSPTTPPKSAEEEALRKKRRVEFTLSGNSRK